MCDMIGLGRERGACVGGGRRRRRFGGYNGFVGNGASDCGGSGVPGFPADLPFHHSVLAVVEERDIWRCLDDFFNGHYIRRQD